MTMQERLDLRVEVHMSQCRHFERLINILKPEWYKGENPPKYNEDCPLRKILDIYYKADEAWENEEDWRKAIEEAEESCSLALDKFKEDIENTL
jgi:hypothetical protein